MSATTAPHPLAGSISARPSPTTLVTVAELYEQALARLAEAHDMLVKAVEPVLRPEPSRPVDGSPLAAIVDTPEDAPLVSRLLDGVSRIDRLAGTLDEVRVRLAVHG